MRERAAGAAGADSGAGAARVEARGFGWRHAGRRAWALRELDLVIEPGERVLLLGASGSGKSTLLAGLAGILGGDEDGEAAGELRIDGVPAASARGRVGLVLQDPETQLVMSRVGDEVAFGCENLGVEPAQIGSRVDAALAAVGLRVPRAHPTAALSGGQKQRLALASVVAMRPGLLLLDEPTANLDPAGVAEVRDAVAAVTADRAATLVVVEHRVDAWLDLIDRVVVLGDAGELLADGPAREVLNAERARLHARGVWLPGVVPTVSDAPVPLPGAPLLSASQLAVARPGRPPVLVREGLDLALAESDAVALTGPNGIGKSTIALTLAGLLQPLAGELRAEPALAAGLGASPIRWRSRELARRIGTVFQSPEHQFLTGTVRDELAATPRALGASAAAARARADELLERLGLAPLAQAHPFTLSGGQQRRLSVATALAARPAVLVLDEPTFGQDARTWAALVALLAELRAEGTGIVAVTHDELLPAALSARRVELS